MATPDQPSGIADRFAAQPGWAQITTSALLAFAALVGIGALLGVFSSDNGSASTDSTPPATTVTSVAPSTTAAPVQNFVQLTEPGATRPTLASLPVAAPPSTQLLVIPSAPSTTTAFIIGENPSPVGAADPALLQDAQVVAPAPQPVTAVTPTAVLPAADTPTGDTPAE